MFNSIQICSIIRGSIGERSGVRIGHRIIDINGTSTVNMSHQDIVHLLSCTVGDVRVISDIYVIILVCLFITSGRSLEAI